MTSTYRLAASAAVLSLVALGMGCGGQQQTQSTPDVKTSGTGGTGGAAGSPAPHDAGAGGARDAAVDQGTRPQTPGSGGIGSSVGVVGTDSLVFFARRLAMGHPPANKSSAKVYEFEDPNQRDTNPLGTMI